MNNNNLDTTLFTTISNIIEIFEDFMEKHKIIIDTEEIQERLKEDKSVTRENLGNIYGTEYGEMFDNIHNILIENINKNGENKNDNK